MGDTLFYQYIDRLSLFYNYFAFLDTDAYLADQLFIKHQVRVHFCEEYVRGDSPVSYTQLTLPTNREVYI